MDINIDNLNNVQMDVLKEIGNIGAGNAATALAKMMNKKVDMNVPKINVLEFKDINEILGGAENLVVGILLRVTGDLQGNIMFILDIPSARLLVDLMMGEGNSESTEFSDIEQSALKEIGNILSGSYLSALSSLTNLLIMPSIPDLAIDMAGAILSVILIQLGQMGDHALVIETEFTTELDGVKGHFFLIPDPGSLSTILSAIGVKE
jgi:chemotaxis protein CheC